MEVRAISTTEEGDVEERNGEAFACKKGSGDCHVRMVFGCSKVGTAQTKAAMAISSRVLAEMEIPTAHFEDLPKNGKARRKFSSSALICQHSGIANRIEAAVHVWKQKDQRKHMNQHQSLAL
ncbi:hypothetical protein V6N11_005862 [Hibiscus sabdariffa]|uniref:PRONE domain-containing protein n=1 Tax=Hibiscus sabdariffa TaxID=183260 RepID=A0ABR2RP32_9ROSI